MFFLAANGRSGGVFPLLKAYSDHKLFVQILA